MVPNIVTNRNLIVNADKTEEYSIRRTLDQSWKNSKYLGSLLGTSEDIKRRKQLACAAFNKNKKALCSKNISLSVRLFYSGIGHRATKKSGHSHFFKWTSGHKDRGPHGQGATRLNLDIYQMEEFNKRNYELWWTAFTV